MFLTSGLFLNTHSEQVSGVSGANAPVQNFYYWAVHCNILQWLLSQATKRIQAFPKAQPNSTRRRRFLTPKTMSGTHGSSTGGSGARWLRVCACNLCSSHLTVEQEQADVRKMVEKKWKGLLCHRYSPHDWRRIQAACAGVVLMATVFCKRARSPRVVAGPCLRPSPQNVKYPPCMMLSSSSVQMCARAIAVHLKK